MRARPFWTFNKPNVERSIEKQGTWLARRGRDYLAALKRGEVDIAYGRQGDIAYSNLATTQLRTCSERLLRIHAKALRHSTGTYACIGHDAASLTSWRRTVHSCARKSSRARTEGSRPRRDGNTAWTMPLRGCHCGRTWTRRPARMSSQIMTVGSCTTPTPSNVASRSAAMSSVMRRGWCATKAVWPSL